MKLTRLQRRALERLANSRDADLALASRVLARCRRWLLLLLTSGAAAICFWQLQVHWLANGFVGFWVGGVLADFGWLMASHRIAPLMLRIIDWGKVEQLLESERGAL